jgi:hypothetical protein
MAVELKIDRVSDIPNGDDIILIADLREIADILRDIAYDGSPDDYGCLFVQVGDGDYDHVWGCGSSVPWLWALVDTLL